MAYFAQAGRQPAYSQSDAREADNNSGGTYGQGYAAGQAGGYAPQGSYASDGYDATLYQPSGYHAEEAYAGPGAEPDTTYAAPDEFGYVAPTANGGRAGLSRGFNLLGAVASVALVAGVAVWGYKLVMRDVSGVPVVRASTGDMRIAPANPGGTQADHQGLAVNAVAAQGSAEAPADRLTLAPAAIELTDDDKPMAQLAAARPAATPEPTSPSAADATLSDAAVASFQNGDIDALVAELAAEAESLSAGGAATAVRAAAPAPAIVQPAPVQPVAAAAAAANPSPALLKAPGVKVSLRPQARPARITPVAATSAAPVARATVEVDPTTLAAGTRMAQLGAYESAEVARAEWDRIHAKFSDYLNGKQRVIQRAQSGGRTFYRLRAVGFDGLSDARRFCSALVAGNADCIPVTFR